MSETEFVELNEDEHRMLLQFKGAREQRLGLFIDTREQESIAAADALVSSGLLKYGSTRVVDMATGKFTHEHLAHFRVTKKGRLWIQCLTQ